MRHTLSLLAMAALLSACAVGPDFQQPDPPAVDHFTRSGDWDIAAPATAVPPAIKHGWWQDFGSPSLNEAVALALRHNPNIQAAVANLEVAQRNVAAQQGYFFPTVQLGVSGSRQNTGNTLSPAVNTSQSPPLLYTLMTKQLSIGFVPDVFGGNRRQVESLDAQAQSQKYQLEALRITVVSNVVAAMVQEASLHMQQTLGERSVEIARQSLAHTRRMFEQGYASRMDLANQEMALGQAVQSLTQVRKTLDQTRDLLAVLCGQFPSENVRSFDLAELQIPAIPSAIPSRLVAQRPDILAAQEMVRAANAQIGVAVANMLPQVSIAAANGGAAAVLNQSMQDGNRYWSESVGISQTLFAGGTLYQRKKAADAATEAALAQYQSTVQTAFQNVADTLYAYHNDLASFDASQDIETANLAVFKATQAQFDTGYASDPGLIASEQNYLQAEQARYQNLAVYLGDVISLYQALGGGWQTDSDQK